LNDAFANAPERLPAPAARFSRQQTVRPANRASRAFQTARVRTPRFGTVDRTTKRTVAITTPSVPPSDTVLAVYTGNSLDSRSAALPRTTTALQAFRAQPRPRFSRLPAPPTISPLALTATAAGRVALNWALTSARFIAALQHDLHRRQSFARGDRWNFNVVALSPTAAELPMGARDIACTIPAPRRILHDSKHGGGR
jgi:hypothetical protein